MLGQVETLISRIFMLRSTELKIYWPLIFQTSFNNKRCRPLNGEAPRDHSLVFMHILYIRYTFARPKRSVSVQEFCYEYSLFWES